MVRFVPEQSLFGNAANMAVSALIGACGGHFSNGASFRAHVHGIPLDFSAIFKAYPVCASGLF
jgi:hypothetical protein